MKTLSFHYPETIDYNDREVKMIIASKLFEMGKLSLGQAAKLAGYSKRTFMELLSSYDVSIFNAQVSELETDVSNAASGNS